MKLIAVVVLLCLLVTGMVSAVAISPGSVAAARTIVPAATVQVSKIPGAFVPVTIVTPAEHGMIEVYSDPPGMAIALNGNHNPADFTPLKFSVPPGTYTVVLSHENFTSYTETFYLASGAIKTINADMKLKPVLSASAAHIVPIENRGMIRPGTDLTIGQVPGALTRITTVPVPVTTTPTIVYFCPNADWSCLTEDEAGQQFGYPNARYGDEPCGYVLVDNTFVFRYCYMDVNSGDALPAGVLQKTGIKKNDSIYIANATWIQHSIVETSPETGQESGGAAPGPLQAVFDFFSSLLGGTPRPSAHLELVELNPCPEPPIPEAGRLR